MPISEPFWCKPLSHSIVQSINTSCPRICNLIAAWCPEKKDYRLHSRPGIFKSPYGVLSAAVSARRMCRIGQLHETERCWQALAKAHRVRRRSHHRCDCAGDRGSRCVTIDVLTGSFCRDTCLAQDTCSLRHLPCNSVDRMMLLERRHALGPWCSLLLLVFRVPGPSS